MREGAPLQVIGAVEPLQLSVVDLSHISDEREREAEAARRAALEAQQPFDLAKGPLFRAGLLRLDETNHVLLMTMHHIVSDGWSMGVLYRELSTLYNAYSTGWPPALTELPISYADFAIWQREWLSGSRMDQLLRYWKQTLAGAPSILDLPADRPRPAVQVFQGASYSVLLPKALAQGLKILGRQTDTTLFMVLLAAFNVLLSRYASQTDIVVGSPIAGRTRAELENLIGFFVNTLVLRTELSGNPTFLQLLERVREVTLNAYAHQDMPFEKLVEELQPARDLSHNPLFQVMFVFQNTEQALQLDPQHRAPQFSVGTSKFDLTLCALETAEGLLTIFEYNTSIFEAATIVALAQNFQILLDSVTSDPRQPISKLLLLSQEQRKQLLIECNQTSDSEAGTTCIHELVEHQAALRPNDVAIVFGEQRLTYFELNARANQLARALREQGIGPEVLVGLCVEKSLEMMIGLMGILKAGGAFVPLDPAYPPDRISFVLADTRAPILLTQEHLLSSLPVYTGKIFCLDRDWSLIDGFNNENLEPIAVSNNLAYVTYTSGSTGRPKGVMVPHRGVCNVAEVQGRMFAVKSEARVLQFASLSFDAAVFEIVMTLRAGASLYLPARESMLPGASTVQVLRDNRINILTISPSALAVLPRAALPELQTLIVAGEACPAELVARWAHGRRFFNAYGPTEASIWATTAVCEENQTTVPIGYSISNVRVYLLDDYLELIPDGVPGEIYIGGTGVTRGYLGLPGLTAERYLPDPFSPDPGARMYRTGDRARRLSSGNLQFLGRVDQQLKLRGYRIELGEIEAVLLLHPAIREAAVLPRRSTSGELYLVAYYSLDTEHSPDVDTLRNFLRQSLPDYMLPSAFVLLDALPLNTNGKLDRRALLENRVDAKEIRQTGWALPRTPTEERLELIWREVLGIPQVGIYDVFFDLGGHSLLATSLMSRVNEAFDIDLPLRVLFEQPTIAGLAEALNAAERGDKRSEEPAIVPVARHMVTAPIEAGSS
jgi:amino acid adenylation domain-containing protein